MRKPEDFWLPNTDYVERCNDCPHPNGCVGECKLEKHVHEDVAKVRGEQKQ
jgi:radical SAM protein with 4Fe4S-binding SPASM domain